ncbi:DNA polymerase III subunit delta' [Sporomusa aerivorans]|uniref:DNA polymerase III subunit delta' n=1 Tax=Sporomusa aerivorans TaxID=204936 RepID=UPI00352A13D4
MLNWDEIIGHQQVVAMVKAMLSSGNLPHALLFTGPLGVGKSLIAQILAAGILCSSDYDKPCGHCQSCMQFNRGAHPDFILVRPDGANIKIDQIRLLQHFAALSPAISHGRVCLIEDTELMTVQAANSLLKLLEEPPPGFVFILVAGTSKPLLPTILSRCRKISFQQLPADVLAQALVNQGYSSDAAVVAARLSGGRMGKALSLIKAEGLESRTTAVELINCLYNRDRMAVWEQAARLESLDNKDIVIVLEFVLYLLRDVLLVAGRYDEQLIYNIDLESKLAAWAGIWSENACMAALSAVRDTIRAIGGNANTRLALEELLIKLRDLVEKGD